LVQSRQGDPGDLCCPEMNLSIIYTLHWEEHTLISNDMYSTESVDG